MNVDDYNHMMVFTSHHRALYIYERLLRKKLQVKLVNGPNRVNSSCTQAVKFKEKDMEVVKQELQRNNIYPTAVYKINRDGKSETYELLE